MSQNWSEKHFGRAFGLTFVKMALRSNYRRWLSDHYWSFFLVNVLFSFHFFHTRSTNGHYIIWYTIYVKRYNYRLWSAFKWYWYNDLITLLWIYRSRLFITAYQITSIGQPWLVIVRYSLQTIILIGKLLLNHPSFFPWDLAYNIPSGGVRVRLFKIYLNRSFKENLHESSEWTTNIFSLEK